MTIKVNGITAIDDNKNFFLENLTFSDASSLSSLALAPGSLKWTLDNANAYNLSGLNDQFGTAIASSDEYLIVGTWQEDDAGGTSSGKAYIFNVTTGALLWTLDNPNAYSTSASDQFGTSVAVSGNYAIISANAEDDSGGGFSGKAYIYNVTTGALLWTLNNPNAYSTSAGEFFGQSVAISGNYAIVGAYGEDDTAGLDSGKAYIYNVTTGALLFTLDNPNAYSTGDNDNFGRSIAISGNYAVVGAYNEDDVGGSASGKAYIYNVTTGALLFTLDNPNAYSASALDQFGRSVAVSGNYAIVSAYQEDDTAGTSSGKAYIYNVTTGALLYTLNNPNAYSTSLSDEFGGAVSISGNYAIVGAYGEDDAGGVLSGKAYIYNVTTGVLLRTLDNPYSYDRTSGDQFGFYVTINSSMAFVGGNLVNSASGLNSGAVYSYNLNNYAPMYTFTNPLLSYDVSPDGTDRFGWSVAMSGNYAIVGAPWEKDTGGSFAGKAYIYNVTTGALLFILNNPTPIGSSSGDEFGTSVAISGNYAIVGAYGEDDSGGGLSGKAYIYNVATGTLMFTLNNPNAYSTSAGDQFGISVAISGNYAIVGAFVEDDASGTSSGKAYIFNVTTGALLFTLNNPNAYDISAADTFGNSVSISGNYAIVGALSEDDLAGAASGKAYIYNVTTGALLFTLNNPNAYSTSASDQFGQSVAISGNYAIVSAYQEDGAGGSNESGKAYIFNVTTGALLFTLDNPNAYGAGQNDTFGFSVAISGNYAIVGAYQEDDAGGGSSGKAYIFNVTTGALLFTLNNPNAYSTSADDQFGRSVAISDNYAIVGAYGEDDVSGFFAGKAYIFNIASPQKYTGFTSLSGLEKLVDQNTIVDNSYLKFTLNNPNAYSTSASDEFGTSVAISGNYAIVGAYFEDDAGGTGSGKAYIYNVTTGALLWTLNNPNVYSTSNGDRFGYSVAISGNYAIVGAPTEDDASNTDPGKAYIYNVTTGALLFTLSNPNAYFAPAADEFGWPVAISGNYAIVGAYKEDDAGGTNSGKAYIFNVTTGALLWTLNNPNAYGTSATDQFSWAVAISGNYAIISANLEDDVGGTSSGKAYIYNVTTGVLLFTLNNPNAYSTSLNDEFGRSVAISGNYAIVGAYFEDDAAGVNTGKAYIYNVTTGALLSTLNNPNAYDTSANDNFGSSVAISGNYAIVGAYSEDDVTGSFSGKAYIFNVTTGALVFTIDNPNPYGTSASDQFGHAVAISGNYAIVAANNEDDAGGSESGKAYIYRINNLNYQSLQDKLISLFDY